MKFNKKNTQAVDYEIMILPATKGRDIMEKYVYYGIRYKVSDETEVKVRASIRDIRRLRENH